MPDGKFQIVSKYVPAGDQPNAINGLVDGLNHGDKYQTLLGATGTGKSVAWNEPVTVRLPDGIYRGTIGALIDSVIGPEQFAETVETSPKGWEIVSWNPKTGETGWQPISAVSRHKSPETMFWLQTKCGRSVTITGDHSVWVLRDGVLTLVEGSDIRSGDALPIPRSLPEPENSIEFLNLLEHVEHPGLYVSLPDHLSRATIEAAVDGDHPRQKSYRVSRFGEGVLLDTGRRLLASNAVALSELFVGGKVCQAPAHLPLSESLLTLFGQYVAEGHGADRTVVFSVRDPEVRHCVEASLRNCGIPYFFRQDTDFASGSRLWLEVFRQACGSRSEEKRLPAFWPSLSNERLGWLLRAYFEGDGGVEKGGVLSISINPALMADLAEALLRFGIWARLRVTQKKKPNGTYGTYTKLTISGAENLRRYAEQIGFLSHRKTTALGALLGADANTNVDLVFEVGRRLRTARLTHGLTQQELAERTGLAKGTIRAIESGLRNPSRAVFQTLAHVLNLPSDFAGLGNIFWSPVETVEAKESLAEFVYDFSVPGCETFLTGSGGLFVHNTYSIANVIERTQRPTLVIAHNKTLVAQLCSEFREFFPHNAVEYFVSYFDYYQPEAYIPSTDTFIEKDSQVNDEIDRLRHAATQAVLERRDVIIVASVSCIYGLGSPQNYKQNVVWFNVGREYDRNEILERLVGMQFSRNDIALARATFRFKGDTLELMPKDEEIVYRIVFDWDTCSRIQVIDWLTGDILDERDSLQVFPASHFVSDPEGREKVLREIEDEMLARKKTFEAEGKLIEAQRIEQRVKYDMEMIREIGFCSGVENYSRIFDGRPVGSAPHTLMDYFPDDFLVVIDESHQTIPQLNAMYAGDKRRKETLIEFGFRLPSAADNRPLRFQEFQERASQTILVSATPGPWEREHSSKIVEQIIRPTGLIDPEIQIRPIKGQIDDLISEIQKRTERGERVIVTTLTKKMAEDLTEYLVEIGTKVQYLHSDVHTLERSEILRDLRLGIYDVIVGINLLREGIDLPEVSLVAILDADKEGFLRSETSLIQTIGRAARNVGGLVLMYADNITGSMRRAIDETDRRRVKQVAYNVEHNITPTTVKKAIADVLAAKQVAEAKSYYKVATDRAPETLPLDQLLLAVTDMEKEMKAAARNLDFEHAAQLRDEIGRLKKLLPTDAKKK